MKHIAYLLTLLVSGPLAAQAASSSTYFMASVEIADGGQSDTLLYRLQSAQGAGLVPEPCSKSATYTLEGGFPATLESPIVGSPWATGVRPLFVPPSGSPTITIHGTEMNLGPVPNVTIGGQPAPVISRTFDRMTVTLPDQMERGYQPVQLSSILGTTVLPRGVGVLPLLETICPVVADAPSGIRYRGTQFDNLVLLIGVGVSPFPIPLLNFGYFLQLDASFLIASVPFIVGSPSGSIDFYAPPAAMTGILHLQALTFGTSNPGYAPGSFSNYIVL